MEYDSSDDVEMENILSESFSDTQPVKKHHHPGFRNVTKKLDSILYLNIYKQRLFDRY